jgi:hypothetical protein
VVEEIIIASSNDAALEAKAVFWSSASHGHAYSYKIRGVRAPNSTKLIAHKKQAALCFDNDDSRTLVPPFYCCHLCFLAIGFTSDTPSSMLKSQK